MKAKQNNNYTKIRAAALVFNTVVQRATVLLAVGIIILALLYMYFLASAVVHAVVRKEVQHTIAEAHSRVADLEVSYLARKNTITHEVAKDLGFKSVAQKSYVERARYLGRADTAN